MHKILTHTHTLFAIFFLIAAFAAVTMSTIRFFQKGSFTVGQHKVARLSFIASHIQLLIGLILWGSSGFIVMMKSDMKAVMQDASLRKLALEHPLTNIIAIVLISYAFISMKKMTDDQEKHNKIIIFYGLALILILKMLPYELLWQTLGMSAQ